MEAERLGFALNGVAANCSVWERVKKLLSDYLLCGYVWYYLLPLPSIAAR